MKWYWYIAFVSRIMDRRWERQCCAALKREYSRFMFKQF